MSLEREINAEQEEILREFEKAKRRAGRARIYLAITMTILVFFALFLWRAGVKNEELAAQNAHVANTQAQEKQTLAEEFAAACEKDDFKASAAGRNVCAKAESVSKESPKVVEGPQGPAGRDGQDGQDGRDGIDGADGKNGLNGKDGKNGTDGVDGANGLNGADGPPGPAGPAGPAGANGTDGADGAPGPAGPTGPAPSSFTFTDSNGVTYTCVPNPPGSTTYSCSPSAAEPTPQPSPIL